MALVGCRSGDLKSKLISIAGVVTRIPQPPQKTETKSEVP